MRGSSISDYAGSSPRMRGAHRQRKARLKPFGIIPAYAGSTQPEYTGLIGW